VPSVDSMLGYEVEWDVAFALEEFENYLGNGQVLFGLLCKVVLSFGL
jgi:hypothetical protein